MMSVAPDGYILHILPFNPATKNDAPILTNIMGQNAIAEEAFQNEDDFIVDQGFRDVKKYLQPKGFKTSFEHFASLQKAS